MNSKRDSWVEAFRYVRKRDLLAALEGVPDDAILYRSPVTDALVIADQIGPEQDMSDEIMPFGGQPVMTPEIALRALLTFYPDGTPGTEALDTEPGWWQDWAGRTELST